MSNGRVRSDFTPARLFVGRPRDAWGRRIGTASPSARELFEQLRPVLLASRPLVKPAETAKYPEERMAFVVGKDGKRVRKLVKVVQSVHRPAVFGKPTFRNAIIDGEHV